MRKRILVAMSGGVDSSTALILLKNQGFEPYGVTMELLNGIKGITPFTEKQSAKQAADRLGIGFEAVDYSRDFEECVIKNFVNTYLEGGTPNPCIQCNKYLKFGKLFKKADELGIEYIATGHYARIEEKSGVFYLKKAKDIKKDQSYVLCNLTQSQLSRLVFPLGELTKDEIRLIAKESGLSNASKSDSQDICFIKDKPYFNFVEEYSGIKNKKGDFVDKQGNKMGTHDGSVKYTIGQRRGLGTGFGERVYVVGKNANTNTVMLGSDSDLYTDTVYLKNVSYIFGIPEAPFKANLRIRYQQKEQPAVIYPDGSKLKAVFEQPQRAVAAGQWGVVYDGDYVICGGIIE